MSSATSRRVLDGPSLCTVCAQTACDPQRLTVHIAGGLQLYMPDATCQTPNLEGCNRWIGCGRGHPAAEFLTRSEPVFAFAFEHAPILPLMFGGGFHSLEPGPAHSAPDQAARGRVHVHGMPCLPRAPTPHLP